MQTALYCLFFCELLDDFVLLAARDCPSRIEATKFTPVLVSGMVFLSASADQDYNENNPDHYHVQIFAAGAGLKGTVIWLAICDLLSMHFLARTVAEPEHTAAC